MPEGDADNFLNLAAAMKILLARTITKSELPRARELLTDYWWRFLKVSPGLLIYFAHPDRSYLLPVSPRYSEAQPSLSGPYLRPDKRLRPRLRFLDIPIRTAQQGTQGLLVQ